MDLNLTEKRVLVTGSSRGLGKAIAEEYLQEGARVCLAARGEEALLATQGELQSRFGKDRVQATSADLSEPDGVRRCIGFIERNFGDLDILVANVGQSGGAIGTDLSPEDWQRLLNVNLVGPALLMIGLSPLLKKRRGNVVVISSIAGREALPAPIPYSASKSGLAAVAKNYSRWLAKDGVRINIVCPGNILTPGGVWEKKLEADRSSVERYIQAEVPLGRLAAGKEIADAVLFLSSDRASFITGSTLVVDGGQTRSFL